MKMYDDTSVIVHIALFNLPKLTPEIPSAPPYLTYHAPYMRLALGTPARYRSCHAAYDSSKRQRHNEETPGDDARENIIPCCVHRH
jgi:hypothetical protein